MNDSFESFEIFFPVTYKLSPVMFLEHSDKLAVSLYQTGSNLFVCICENAVVLTLCDIAYTDTIETIIKTITACS